MNDFFSSTAVHYRHSPAETRRFGLSVGRLVAPAASDPATSLSLTLELLTSAAEDMVVLRYPSDRVTWFAQLRTTGRDLIHADSMIYFDRDLTRGVPELPPGWPPTGFRLVGKHEVDVDALLSLVPAIFDRLGNHYVANPILDHGAALEGYQEWVRHSLTHDEVVCVVDADHYPLGFLTLTTGSPRAELLLGGIVPRARRQGAFGAVFAMAARVAGESGSAVVGGPTHLHNVATQRAFWGAGYRPAAGVTTVHALRPGLITPGRQ